MFLDLFDEINNVLFSFVSGSEDIKKNDDELEDVNMIELELKPCPFCGGSAEYDTHTHCFGHGEYAEMGRVRCRECGCSLEDIISGIYWEDKKLTKIDIVNRWNNRV